ncbi:MAG: sulfatase [Deltaproteobacteria bacterium]|nr:sulfatase [Deltaproteobacteria bacterium]
MPADNRPNIIFILADDLGYSELGCYGNKFNETPNIDKMTMQGIRFTQAYAAAPVCSPYRAALMTGQYPARVGITDYLKPDDSMFLDTSYVLLPEVLKANGYHTGIIGKWHLSGYRSENAPVEVLPDQQGFDEVLISENRGIGPVSFFYPYHFNREIVKKLPTQHEHLIDRQNMEAVDFIERNKEQPFFLYLSHYAVHTNVHGKPELVDYFRKKKGAQTSPPHINNQQNDPYKKWPADFQAPNNNPHLAAQLFSIDEGVGMIMEKLRELDIDKNTVVIFTSDNGGETNVTDNSPLRAGKSSLYEGGIRIPLLIWNPGMFGEARDDQNQVVNYDFYPTFMELTGTHSVQQKMDGVSLIEILKKPGIRLKERSLFWHYPLEKPHFLGGRSSGSIIKGDWKLIEFFDTDEKELYNIRIDITEERNLVGDYPDKMQELLSELSEWRQKVQY